MSVAPRVELIPPLRRMEYGNKGTKENVRTGSKNCEVLFASHDPGIASEILQRLLLHPLGLK